MFEQRWVFSENSDTQVFQSLLKYLTHYVAATFQRWVHYHLGVT